MAAVVGIAWQFAQREPSDDVASQPKTSCPEPAAQTSSETAKVPVVPAEKVKVNVYNATSRAGLASDTANALKRRGFRIGKVANDPTNRKVTGEAEVRHGPKGKAAARTVGAQVGDVGTSRTVDRSAWWTWRSDPGSTSCRPGASGGGTRAEPEPDQAGC